MKRKHLYISSSIIIFFVLALTAWKKINKKQVPTQDLKEVIQLEEVRKLDPLDTSNFKSLNKFIEQPMMLEGNIKQISFDNSFNMMMITKDSIWVSCKFQKDQNRLLNTYKTGDFIRIKGIYKGALNYLILLNCIVEKH